MSFSLRTYLTIFLLLHMQTNIRYKSSSTLFIYLVVSNHPTNDSSISFSSLFHKKSNSHYEYHNVKSASEYSNVPIRTITSLWLVG